jgi:hypothetical protein
LPGLGAWPRSGLLRAFSSYTFHARKEDSMRRQVSVGLWLAFAGLLIAACGSSDDGDALTELENEYRATIAVACRCLESTAEGQAECLEESSDSLEFSACERRVLNKPEAQQAIACTIRFFRGLRTCLEETTSCTETTLQACAEQQSITECELPASLQAELEACDRFTCGNGETIPGDWVCDEEPDCNDASDERNCT